MRVKRIDQIEDFIIKNKFVTIDELCTEFNISKNTIRRDIDFLTKRGTVKKVYGGVTIDNIHSDPLILSSFQERQIINEDLKVKIAKEASKYIKDGDIIFIDTGTTAANIIDYLEDVKNLTIITNSVSILYKSLFYPNINVVSLPGVLKRVTASLVGSSTLQYIQDYNINKAFMACTGFSIKQGFTNSTHDEFRIKKAIIEKSQCNFMLLDKSKLGKTALLTFCHTSDLDYIIIDSLPSTEYIEHLNENNVALVVADNSQI